MLCFTCLYLGVHKIWFTEPAYPRYVHNTCSNVWAVQTGVGVAVIEPCVMEFYPMYFYESKKTTLYFGPLHCITMRVENEDRDVPSKAIGGEYQFLDSATAVRTYERYLLKQDSIARESQADRQKTDSIKRAKDSIFNCQHSYPQ